jgi:hypothetical protein
MPPRHAFDWKTALLRQERWIVASKRKADAARGKSERWLVMRLRWPERLPQTDGVEWQADGGEKKKRAA